MHSYPACVSGCKRCRQARPARMAAYACCATQPKQGRGALSTVSAGALFLPSASLQLIIPEHSRLFAAFTAAAYLKRYRCIDLLASPAVSPPLLHYHTSTNSLVTCPSFLYRRQRVCHKSTHSQLSLSLPQSNSRLLSLLCLTSLSAKHDHAVHAGLYQASLPLHLCNPPHPGPLTLRLE